MGCDKKMLHLFWTKHFLTKEIKDLSKKGSLWKESGVGFNVGLSKVLGKGCDILKKILCHGCVSYEWRVKFWNDILYG